MKIFVSDIHLGSPLFKKEKELCGLLNSPDVDEIYILGDVIDRYENFTSIIIKKHLELIDLINKCDKVVLVIKGNHDPSIDKLKEIFNNKIITEELEINVCGKKALLVHGDKCDYSIQWLWVLQPIYFIFERLGFDLKAFYRRVYTSLLMLLKDKKYNSILLSTEKRLVDKYKDKYNILIVGHTHLAKIVDVDDFKYINCGSLVDEPSYVVIDKNIITIERL